DQAGDRFNIFAREYGRRAASSRKRASIRENRSSNTGLGVNPQRSTRFRMIIAERAYAIGHTKVLGSMRRTFSAQFRFKRQQAATAQRFGTGFQSAALVVGGQPQNDSLRAWLDVSFHPVDHLVP